MTDEEEMVEFEYKGIKLTVSRKHAEDLYKQQGINVLDEFKDAIDKYLNEVENGNQGTN